MCVCVKVYVLNHSPLCFTGAKLKTNPVTSAVAAQIYHRFLDAVNDSNYDPYVSEKHRITKECVLRCVIFLIDDCSHSSLHCQ